MKYESFISKYENVLQNYWNGIKTSIVNWKLSYEWPIGTQSTEANEIRDNLEVAINKDLQATGCLSKQTFDTIMAWGFGRPSYNTEREISIATCESFNYLKANELYQAASALTKLDGIGISRASKVLALSNQSEIGIYDSRAAHGLSDLLVDAAPLIPIPPGRSIRGSNSVSQGAFCAAFQTYNWILRYFRDLAQKDSTMSAFFSRVADLEMAFFARSRAGLIQEESIYASERERTPLDLLSESDLYITLGKGNKGRQFWAFIDERGITVLTGQKGKTYIHFSHTEVEKFLSHFSEKGWFLLGNAVDNVAPGGLGEYFKVKLRTSPKFASHFSALMVEQGMVVYRYGLRNRLELKVINNRITP